MENIRRAIERAKTRDGGGGERIPAPRIDPVARRLNLDASSAYEVESEPNYQGEAGLRQIELDAAHLESERIVSHVITDPLSRPFDMLRTQILQSMDTAGSKILAVTSPTPGCGKTVTAVNLALSIARQPERSVLLMDLDFQKPRVTACLGLPAGRGILNVVHGKASMAETILHTRIGIAEMMVLPTGATSGSSELMSSRAMAKLFQDVRRDPRAQTIIVDLPPILSSDDVIAILPQVDCVLLVVAVGTSKVAEIEECNRHLQSTDVIRIAVNKVPDLQANYYYY
jgi:capsular exopolysaccharide synthesis family protein